MDKAARGHEDGDAALSTKTARYRIAIEGMFGEVSTMTATFTAYYFRSRNRRNLQVALVLS